MIARVIKPGRKLAASLDKIVDDSELRATETKSYHANGKVKGIDTSGSTNVGPEKPIAKKGIGARLRNTGKSKLAAAAPIATPDFEITAAHSDWALTSKPIVAAARKALARFDVDPCSCMDAQSVVQAGTSYTKADSPRSRSWRGRVFMFPPLTKLLKKAFADKLIAELDAGNTSAAILLANPDWITDAVGRSTAVCFLKSPPEFQDISRRQRPSMPPQGMLVLYFGSDVQRFSEAFGELGVIITRSVKTRLTKAA
jgi:hypothetical protein